MKFFGFFSFFILLTISESFSAEMKLAPFETDGCTLFMDGTASSPKLWKHCCVEHDLRYWFGGNSNDMDATDLRLKSCVNKAAGDNWAILIYNGVRAGHYSPIKNKYQWGWAWKEKREKKPLTEAEADYIRSELRKMKVEGVNLDEFISLNLP